MERDEILRYLAVIAVEARGGLPYQAEQVANHLGSWIDAPSSVMDASVRLDMALGSAGLPRRV